MAGYYQKNKTKKKMLQKSLLKSIKIYVKKIKIEIVNILVNNI